MMGRRIASLNRDLRKWMRADCRRFVRLDFSPQSNRFWAVGCEGDPRGFRVIVSTSHGRTPEKALRKMLQNSERGK